MKTYSHTLPVNERIADRYRIQSVLGEGGFGITYRAWDEHLERLVVVKEYLPGELGVRDSDTLRVTPPAPTGRRISASGSNATWTRPRPWPGFSTPTSSASSITWRPRVPPTS